MPPTGISSAQAGRTSVQAFIAAGPTWTAGKTLTARAPADSAANASDGVAAPG